MSIQQYRINGTFEATYPGGNKTTGKIQNQTVSAEFPQYAMWKLAEEIMSKRDFVEFTWLQVWAEQIKGSTEESQFY